MTMQNILSTLRKAIEEYDMIQDGDHVAVGLSGGKDSLVLLAGLAAFQKFSPKKFSLSAVTIDLGITKTDYTPLKDYVASLGVDYHIVETEIGSILFDIRKEKNPCSLCSKMRRGALNTKITELGCNKLALGHHSDDLVETFFLSLIYEGRLSTFAPKSYMDRSKITLIRPLLYTQEKNIAAFAKDLPVTKNPCPANHETQREYMKNLIKGITNDIPFAKDRMFSAIINPDRYNLFDKYKNDDKA